MKKISKTRTLILLTFGLFVIAFSQIVSHFNSITDLTKGLFMGIGFGLMLTSIFFGKFKTAQ